ncbi:MAG: hypothetical protein HQL07_04490 [Nitrospirae bacterium]|nr:hypothetical protein [Magnetococcales bacterium]HAT50746.1 hypothetical protein [Alphaproteobacteria bacterium]
MFKIQEQRTVTWPVEVRVPVSGGRFEKAEFQVDFALLDQSRIDEILHAEDRPTSMDVAFLREAVTGFRDVRCEDGGEMAFSSENLGILLGIPYVRNAMIEAFFSCISGRRRGN